MELTGEDLVKMLGWARSQGIAYESMRRAYTKVSEDYTDALKEISELKRMMRELGIDEEGYEDER